MSYPSSGGSSQKDRNHENTVWVGGLDPQMTEELLFELMVQVGPIADVSMPRDKISGQHQNYGFVEFSVPEDAEYAMGVMSMIKLFGKSIRVNKASKQREQEVFANLFIGNLDPDVDEKLLYHTFSSFGCVISAKVMTDEQGKSKGFGFINYDDFDCADGAIETMNGQYLANRAIHVSYAYKKDGTKGERHGSQEERELAKKSKGNVQAVRPQQNVQNPMFPPRAPAPQPMQPLPMAMNMMPPPMPPPLPPSAYGMQQPPMHLSQQPMPLPMAMPPPLPPQFAMRPPPPPPLPYGASPYGYGAPMPPPPPPSMYASMGMAPSSAPLPPPPPPQPLQPM